MNVCLSNRAAFNGLREQINILGMTSNGTIRVELMNNFVPGNNYDGY